MKDWIKVSLLLCCFGALRDYRPSEPFVSEYLSGEWWDITEDQLNREVYPLGTYSYLVLLVFVFLITDFLRFKPVIILSGLSGIAVYAILLWTSTIEWVKASQFFYGLYMATEVAYLTYIYAKVDEVHYPKVSSYTRMAALAGRFLSGVSSQLLVFFNGMNIRDLNYLTFGAQILATFWAFLLPSVNFGIYFHRRKSTADSPDDKAQPDERTFRSHVVEASTLIGRHARAAYTRPKVLAWSALYAVSLTLFVQTQIYAQLLWIYKQGDNPLPVSYNGAVEAALTLLGAVGAFIASVANRPSFPAPVICVQGVAIFVGTYVPGVYTAYAGYIAVGMLFHYIITLSSAKIAGQLSDDSCFGLIFGINTLLGTGLQSLLTYVINQNMQLSILAQYYVISVLYLSVSFIWLVGWIVHVCKQRHAITNMGNQYYVN